MVATRGSLRAAVDIGVIALVMGMIASDRNATAYFDGDPAEAAVVFGGIPGVMLAPLLGAIDAIAEVRSLHLRISLLVLPAMSIVLGLAVALDLLELLPTACIPTFATAMLLEQWTGRPAPPPIPVAITQAMHAVGSSSS